MARDLDGQLEAFRTRPLDAGPYTFLTEASMKLITNQHDQPDQLLPGGL